MREERGGAPPWRGSCRRLLAAALVALAAAACSGRGEGDAVSMPQDKGFNVYKEGRLVLWMKGEPGAVLSTATPRPGTKPARHPFLTAQARDPFEEDSLRALLEKSTTFEGFVRLLKDGGYQVEAVK